MALRDLRVDMRAIVDARQRLDIDPAAPYLDLKTGEVVVSIDEAISGEPTRSKRYSTMTLTASCSSSGRKGATAGNV
jgi:hypothetical protein